MANSTMTLISSQTLGGTTASVTFSSIPSTYNDLKLVVSARVDAATTDTGLSTIFNSDSGTNYSWTAVLAYNGTNTFSNRSYGGLNVQVLQAVGANATASVFGCIELYIPNYTSTGTKPVFNLGVAENNSEATGNRIGAVAGQYRGASGISSITLTPSSGNFVQYSTFTLYGIKNS
jgi:hypothetical protein